MTSFAQLSARLKNILGGWLLVFGIKEGLIESATVCVKSVVILVLVPAGVATIPLEPLQLPGGEFGLPVAEPFPFPEKKAPLPLVVSVRGK